MEQWQSLYASIMACYCQVSYDYQDALANQSLLRDMLSRLDGQQQLPLQVASEEPLQSEIHVKAPRMRIKRKTKKSKRRGRHLFEDNSEQQFFKCIYENCDRTYSSPISLNLHIKQKHNGGTKKERQIVAQYMKKMLLQAEENGKEIPDVHLNFPPEFLDEYRQIYTYFKKYSA